MSGNNISIDNLLKEENKVQDQIDDLILELIKERKKRKITQVQLSKATGIPQATISRLESFNSVPSLQVLIKIAQSMELFLAFSSVRE